MIEPIRMLDDRPNTTEPIRVRTSCDIVKRASTVDQTKILILDESAGDRVHSESDRDTAEVTRQQRPSEVTWRADCVRLTDEIDRDREDR